MEIRFLISAHPLIMLYICNKVTKFYEFFVVLERIRFSYENFQRA